MQTLTGIETIGPNSTTLRIGEQATCGGGQFADGPKLSDCINAIQMIPTDTYGIPVKSPWQKVFDNGGKCAVVAFMGSQEEDLFRWLDLSLAAMNLVYGCARIRKTTHANVEVYHLVSQGSMRDLGSGRQLRLQVGKPSMMSNLFADGQNSTNITDSADTLQTS